MAVDVSSEVARRHWLGLEQGQERITAPDAFCVFGARERLQPPSVVVGRSTSSPHHLRGRHRAAPREVLDPSGEERKVDGGLEVRVVVFIAMPVPRSASRQGASLDPELCLGTAHM